jgi:DNA polymerase III alpha subunit
MHTDKFGRVIYQSQDLIDLLYQDKPEFINQVIIEDSVETQQFQQNLEFPLTFLNTALNDVSIDAFDNQNQSKWFMPEDYCPNLVEMLYGLCTTPEQSDRVSEELELFVQHGMFDLLYYLKYLVDTMRENNVVWGVGRGSSVASYVLFLIGVHKIDSLKYKLDYREFLR